MRTPSYFDSTEHRKALEKESQERAQKALFAKLEKISEQLEKLSGSPESFSKPVLGESYIFFVDASRSTTQVELTLCDPVSPALSASYEGPHIYLHLRVAGGTVFEGFVNNNEPNLRTMQRLRLDLRRLGRRPAP